MRRFKHGIVVTQVRAGREAKSANEASAQVAHDVAKNGLVIPKYSTCSRAGSICSIVSRPRIFSQVKTDYSSRDTTHQTRRAYCATMRLQPVAGQVKAK
jgi:hypothetical protein